LGDDFSGVHDSLFMYLYFYIFFTKREKKVNYTIDGRDVGKERMERGENEDGKEHEMALKWLQERWETLLPALEPLGREQEEHMREICEAEKEWWRRRPGMKQMRSLAKPMTETRNRIREVLLVGEENWWMNPKSGAKEHLALKYMNFSTEEWTQMGEPREEEVQSRLGQPLVLTQPEVLIERGESLLQMETWPEIVLGIGVNTGRSLAEILKTGLFGSKTTYSVLFAGPMTVYEQMCPFFEVPTFTRAELVLEALRRVRQMFGMQFAYVSRRDVGRQCGPMIRQAAYQHFGDLVPLRPGEADLYKSLTRGVYERLATYYFCPSHIDELIYMATITGARRVLAASSAEERVTAALTTSFFEYVMGDGSGGCDRRKGMRLDESGIEVLEVFQEQGRGEETLAE